MLVLLALLACRHSAPSAEPAGGTDQGGAVSDDRLRELGGAYVDPAGAAGLAVGLVIGVSVGGEHHVVGLGATEVGGSRVPDATTVFEIGSVTKVFTGLLLARAERAGELRLDQPIDPWFPSGTPHWDAAVPVSGEPGLEVHASIALLDLATHTSGLPDLPPNLGARAPGNPAAGYSREDLESFLSTFELPYPPGTRFAYSNLGAGLLGEIEVRASRASDYEALVVERIAAPLGLRDTRVVLDAEQETRAAAGHLAGRESPRNAIGPPLWGGGALRSTAADLLTFLDGALGRGPPEVTEAWDEVLVPRRPSGLGIDGRTGLLTNVERWEGHDLWSKNGRTAGFQSQVFLDRPSGVAVVLLADSGDVRGLRALGLAVLGEVLPD